MASGPGQEPMPGALPGSKPNRCAEAAATGSSEFSVSTLGSMDTP